jgi:nucleoside-diphosphate-sugar epimerase
MKVLIIGGLGKIATAISKELLARGCDITLYGRRPGAAVSDSARFVMGDRDDFNAFEAQMAGLGQFDCVIDMICFRPEQAESDVRAFAGRTRQLLFTSTVDVYSKPAHTYPVVESEPRRGSNPYGQGKVLSEDVFLAAHSRGDLSVTIIRPAMTYGGPSGIVDTWGWGTKYIDRMRKSKPIIVHGDGSSLWVATYVDDAARAFANAVGNPRTFGQAYHVTGEEWMTWNRYYTELAEASGAPTPTLVHIPTDVLAAVAPQRALWCATNFSGNSIFDNSAARADLDFHYTVPWKEGARRMVAWLDAHNAVENSDEDDFDDRILAAWNTLASDMRDRLTGLER